MRGKRSALRRVVSTALSAALLVTQSGFAPLPVSAAENPLVDSLKSAPTVVREIVDARTETSEEYLLSDGTIRARFHAGPVRYRDAASGELKDIDTALADATSGGTPVSVNKANRFRLILPKDLSSRAVSVEESGCSVSIRPSWKSRPGEASPTSGALAASPRGANSRLYEEAYAGADLEYESRPEGLKESIVLSRPISANVFGFELSLTGLTPRIEADRSLSLISDRTGESVFTIPAPSMMDASGSTIGGDYSDAVHYELSRTGDIRHLDVVADAAWLSDPARVYPVRIDPTVQTTSITLVSSLDTFVSSAYQTTNYVTHTALWVNTHDPAADWTEYAYAQPGATFVSTLGTKKAAGYQVVASRLSLYAYTIAHAGSVAAGMCTTGTTVNLSALNWNNQPGSVSSYYSPYTTAALGWNTHDVTKMVSYWQGAATPKDNCTAIVQSLGATNGHVGYRSADYATTSQRPVWEVDFAPTPSVSVTSPTTSTVSSVPSATWSFTEALGNPEAEWQLEVATSTAGPSIASTGAQNAATTSALPTPAGGYQPGQTYYVRVRAASSPSTATPRLWSAWAVSGAFTPVTPSVSVSAPMTETVTEIPAATWSFTDPAGATQAEWQIEVATSTAGPSIASTSAAGDATSATLPVPSGGYQAGQAYYARVRATASPVGAASRFWSAWSASGAFTPTLPAAVSAVSAATTMTPAWFIESDTNGDGFTDVRNDANTSGRGSVTLSWEPVSGASGYDVYLSDGYQMRKVASTLDTSWSSAGAGVYPTDSQIASLSAGTTSNPFPASGGLDLRDDPRPLYAKTAGASIDASTAYRFEVRPYNAYGSAPAGVGVADVAFEDRSARVNDEPEHTVYSIGDALHHEAGIELDRGRLTLDVTDLSIASWGPEASLTRHYSSDATTPLSFSAGWTFGFEQRLVVNATDAVWTDASGDAHVFQKVGGAWVSPNGTNLVLRSALQGWEVVVSEDDILTFSATGTLLSERDRNGNTVTYLAGPGTLTVIAANGQAIDVTLSGTDVTSARYVTADGTREVTYSKGVGGLGTVTHFPGTSDEYQTIYTYGTTGTEDGRLIRMAIPGYEWPDLSGEAWWSFGYDPAGRILKWNLLHPSIWAPHPDNTVAYGTLSATVSLARTASTFAATDFAWNPDGSTSARSNPGAAAEKTSYTYSVRGDVTSERSPLGALTTRSFDTSGNVVRETDALGNATTSTWSAGRLLTRTDPLGSATTYTYDTAGNLLTELKTLDDSGRTARTDYERDAAGRVTRETVALDDTRNAVTTYADFAKSGTAQTVTNVGVELGLATKDLVSTSHYDEFGDLIWQKDASGRYTTKQNTWSASGRLIASEAVTGTVTHHRYSKLGYGRETSTTAGGSYSDWSLEVTDIRGNRTDLVRNTEAGWDSGETMMLDERGLVTYRMEYALPNTNISTYDLDAAGRVVVEHLPGLGASGRSTAFDAEGRVTSVTEPSAAASTRTTYDALGRTTRIDNADGTWTEYGYDAAGNQVSQTTPVAGGTVTKRSEYDRGGRLIRSIDEKGVATDYALDRAGRTTVVSANGTPTSTIALNSLGQELERTDADGIRTTTRYDEAGHVTSSIVADKETRFTFDAAGRLATRVEPDFRAVEFVYDPFSRIIDEKHTVAGSSAPVRERTTTYDVLSRVVDSVETSGGVTRHVEYDGSSSRPLTSTVEYAGASGTQTFDHNTGLQLSSAISLSGGTARRDVTRNGAGRVASAAVLGLGNLSYTWDEAGRMLTQTGVGFSGAGAASTIETATGRKSAESVTLAYPGATRSHAYTYTSDGRLASEDGRTFLYDVSGSLVAVGSGGATTTLSYDTSAHLVGMGTTAYGWDTSKGWRTSMRRALESSVTYSYTDSGRLSGYSDPNRGIAAVYEYDGAGQRTRSVVTSGSLTTTTTWLYDGLSLLRADSGSSDGTTSSVTYAFDEAGRPFAATFEASGVSPILFHLVTTDRGDVVELLDASGTPFATYGYDAWGAPQTAQSVSRATSDVPTPELAARIAGAQVLRYAGYAWDEHSGLYYLSQRYYDPATFQFLTKDPARADGEESAYQYAGGDPVGKADQSGLLSVPLYTQEQPEWCVAASIQMVVKYLTGTKYGQSDIHYWATGNRDGSKGINTWDAAKVLRKLGISGVSCRAGALSWKGVKWQIDHARPIIAMNAHHAVVIYWYQPAGVHFRQNTVFVNDPDPKGKQWPQPYAEFVSKWPGHDSGWSSWGGTSIFDLY